MQDDKRKHSRFPIHQAIEISLGREDFFNARGINVSEGGMLFETDFELALQARIYLFFQITVGTEVRDVEAEGIVRHLHKTGSLYQVGVEFYDLLPENRELLAAYGTGRVQ